MAPGKRPLSFWTLVVLVVVAALAVGAWALVRASVDRQDKALLQDDESQVVLLLQSALQNLQTELQSVAFFTANSHDSPQVFAEQTKALLIQPTVSVALVERSGPSAQVVLAQGPDMHTSASLPAPLAHALVQSSEAVSASVVHLGNKAFLVTTAVAPSLPNLVAIDTALLDQHHATPNRSGPYAHIYIDVYATPRATPDQLIASTYGPGSLPQPVARTVLNVGSIHWLVQASQKEALTGSAAEASPWVALGIGLFVALVLALVVETFARRERHAARLVAERTTELIEAQKLQLRHERLAALGELATVVGHELRNPLSAAINELYLQRMELRGAVENERLGHITRAENQINRAAHLSEDLTAYMRDRAPVFDDVDFEALVTEALQATPPPSGVEVSVDAPVRVWADPNLMNQVMTNLITNAYEAMPEGGTLHIADVAQDGVALVTIRDSGPGLDPEAVPRIFEPFFTTKDGGTGLGLAIVQRLVERQGGTVSIENLDTKGARVSIRLPKGPTQQ